VEEILYTSKQIKLYFNIAAVIILGEFLDDFSGRPNIKGKRYLLGTFVV